MSDYVAEFEMKYVNSLHRSKPVNKITIAGFMCILIMVCFQHCK